jgi:hypothetical protein
LATAKMRASRNSPGSCPKTRPGDAAITYWSCVNPLYTSPSLFLLDFEVVGFSSRVLLQAEEGLRGLAAEYEAVARGIRVWAPGELQELCRWPAQCGWLDKRMTDDPTRVAMRAASRVSDGRMVITRAAVEMGRRHPLDSALSFVATDPVDAKAPLRQSLLLGIAWGFDKVW